jgi:uncharacterized RDD family membrane protein YckC
VDVRSIIAARQPSAATVKAPRSEASILTLDSTPTPDASPEMRTATWWRRAIARLIDVALIVPFVVVGVVLVLRVWIVGFVGLFVARKGTPVMAPLLFAGLCFLVAGAIWVANEIVHQGRTGRTVGRKLMRIRLVDARTGHPIGAPLCLLRGAIVGGATSLVSGLGGQLLMLAGVGRGGVALSALIIGIDHLWPLWDRRGQRLVDKVIHCRVVAD